MQRGGGEIRTHGTLSDTLVFKTSAIDHSATPPRCNEISMNSRFLQKWYAFWLFCFVFSMFSANRFEIRFEFLPNIFWKQKEYILPQECPMYSKIE